MLRVALRMIVALALLSSLLPSPAHAAPLDDTAQAVLLDADPQFDLGSEGGRAALARVEGDLRAIFSATLTPQGREYFAWTPGGALKVKHASNGAYVFTAGAYRAYFGVICNEQHRREVVFLRESGEASREALALFR